MRALIEDLQVALREALAMGLDTPSALDRLAALAEPLRSVGLEVLAQSVEAITNATPSDEPEYAAVINELVRLWEVCEQVLLRTHPVMTLTKLPESRGWLSLDSAPDEPLIALLTGAAPLTALLPALEEQINRWQWGDSLTPMRLMLGHSVLTQQAGARLREHGTQFLQSLRLLASNTTPLQRIRLAELVMDLYEEGQIRTLQPYLKRLPESMPLRRRAMQLGVALPDSRERAHETLEDSELLHSLQHSGLTRQGFSELMRRHAHEVMCLPDDSPVLTWLLESLEALARSVRDRLELVARVPHPRATEMLLNSPHLTPRALELHIEATRDYRLAPLLFHFGNRSPLLPWGVVNSLGDALFFPIVLNLHPEALPRYAEYAHYLIQHWRNSPDPALQQQAEQIRARLGGHAHA